MTHFWVPPDHLRTTGLNHLSLNSSTVCVAQKQQEQHSGLVICIPALQQECPGLPLWSLHVLLMSGLVFIQPNTCPTPYPLLLTAGPVVWKDESKAEHIFFSTKSSFTLRAHFGPAWLLESMTLDVSCNLELNTQFSLHGTWAAVPLSSSFSFLWTTLEENMHPCTWGRKLDSSSCFWLRNNTGVPQGASLEVRKWSK